jgi:thioredoxin-related protein
MKKLFLSIILASITLSGYCQTDSTQLQPPYKRFPTLPPLKLFLVDSSTYFTKNDFKRKSNVLLMLFSPDCDHCQHETEEIIKHIDQFKNIQIVMATMMSFDAMKSFYQKYELSNYKNIVVGQDQNFFLIPYYNARNLPFLAFYDNHGNLISVFEGSMPIEKVLAEFEKKP